MTIPLRSDPLLFLSGEGSAQDPPEDDTSQPSPEYTTKPNLAPPYVSPTLSIPDDTTNPDTLLPSPGRSLSPPPDYNAFDPLARDFHLQDDLIYTSNTNTPQYQIKLTFHPTGRPHQLRLRRLMPTEIRRRRGGGDPTAPPLPAPLTRSTAAPTFAYDDDMTSYTATLHPTSALEIHGHRASSLPGHITATPSLSSSSFSPFSSSYPSGTTTFHHHTRNKHFDSLDPAHEARIQKYGYHARDEWVKKVLFTARRRGKVMGRVRGLVSGKGVREDKERGPVVEWMDGEGRVCAVEEEEEEEGDDDGLVVKRKRLRLEAGSRAVVKRRMRDVLVMCWAVRLWGTFVGS